MNKILSAAQLRDADSHTILSSNITSWELMEQAAHAFIHAVGLDRLATKKIMVVCGAGNNGGDGLAIGRLLRDLRFDVSIVLVKYKDPLSKDCAINFAKVHDVIEINEANEFPDFSEFDLIIDGIFGTGLTRPVTGFVANLIQAINASGKEVFAIDVPSGLLCDGISASDNIVQADHVISFQRPKLAFFLPENSAYLKKWQVVDIGLDESYIQNQQSTQFVLDESIREFVKSRARQSHKGSYGHALLIAGSYGKIGAAVLSSKGCLRSGVGLLTTHVPKCGYQIIQIAVPEAMCTTDENELFTTRLPDLTPYDAIGIGPGIGKHPETLKMLQELFKKSKTPCVLDADALNLIAENNELFQQLPENTILTPHIKEFDRLAGESRNSIERWEKQREFSKKHKVIIVLKDANTSISSVDGEQFFNTSGNPGMATGGSGDMLTGIITGLLAQKYTPLNAALIGVYFHGLAGDQAAKDKGVNALIASDLCAYLKIDGNS